LDACSANGAKTFAIALRVMQGISFAKWNAAKCDLNGVFWRAAGLMLLGMQTVRHDLLNSSGAK
jgi:hypothetical protein